MRAAVGLVMLPMLMLVVAGCATTPRDASVPDPAPAVEQGDELAWRYARLRFPWGEEGEARWYLDALVAAEIFSPALDRHRGRIPLWRFHRRAGRDEAGHQFSLIVYTDDATATALMAELGANSLVDELERAGVVRDLLVETDVGTERRALSATSDPHWPPDLQRSWPYFAMGVSQTWLALLREQLPEEPVVGARQLMAQYKIAEESVTERWREEGGHAYLHHLNALFGYKTLKVQLLERGEVRF